MSYKLTKGPKFALQRKRAATDLTHDMLQRFATTSLLRTRILQYFYIHFPLLSCHPFCCPQSQALTCCQTILGSYLCSLPLILSVVCKQALGRLLFSHIRLAHQHTDVVLRDKLMRGPIHSPAPVTRELSAVYFAQTRLDSCQMQPGQQTPVCPFVCCGMP